MFRFKIKRGKELLVWPPAIAVLAAIAAILTFRSFDVFGRFGQLRSEREKIEERISFLEAERWVVAEQMLELASADGIERMAKEKLGLRNPGEEVAIVVAEEGTTTTPNANGGFWQRMRSFFRKLFF